MSNTRPKKTTRFRRTQGRHQIIQSDVDKARPHHDPGNRTDTLRDHAISCGKRFVDTLLGENKFSHSRVVEGDQGIRKQGQLIKSQLCLVFSAFPLEIERGCGKYNRKGPLLPGQPRYQGSCTRTGASSQSDADEDNLAVAQCIPNFQFRLLCRLVPKRWITPDPSPFVRFRPS